MTTQEPLDAEQLAARFATLDADYGPVPIWWWSGERLERRRLRWQMTQLIAGGITQAIVMCLAPRGPLYGSLADDPPFMSEPWWDVFLGACEDAHELGFRFWLYDQYGFSGANFQGQLVASNPSWAGQELGRVSVPVDRGVPVRLTAPEGATALSAYVVTTGDAPVPVRLDADGSAEWSGDGGQLVLCYAQSRGFDYYDEAACSALIDTVLGEFQRRAEKWFGPVITGVFQDELPAMPTWGKDFAASFARSHGYDLVERLSCLFEEEDDPAASAVRRDYHAHRAALARDAFFDPYGRWAAGAGLLAGFDQQTPAREGDPVSATELYGDYLRTHAVYSAPGSDHWGDPKIHSSLAHASGQPRTWLEAFHSSGWGGTLEETYDWLGPFLRRGANLYDPHAVYYSTVGGWWEWAPPSTCWRQPYWADYPLFAGAVSRLCSLMAGGELVADTVLLFPTSSVQGGLRLAGGHPQARRTSDVYNELNGSTSWFDERPGVLDRAGHDYEIFDERTLAEGVVQGGTWRVAGGTFHNIVLPAATAVDGRFAAKLARFVDEGGTAVSVGPVPDRYLGPDTAAGARLGDVSGRVRVVAAPSDVPAELVRGPVWAEADCPAMLRRYGETLVLLLVAHDERTGTRMPVFEGNSVEDRIAGTFGWDEYWKSFSHDGYEFAPVGDRRARVRVVGAPGCSAQRWDPRSGERVDLDVHGEDDGTTTVEVSFSDGPMAVVVLGAVLPAATRVDPAGEPQVEVIEGDWEVEARSTLDNQWGDLGEPARRDVLPLQVWRFEHATGDLASAEPPADGWTPTQATFGPYLRVTGPHTGTPSDSADQATWQPYDMSLSRGIRKDPLHFPNLGPKGTVPEEFVRWEAVRAGEWVAFATSVELPEGAARHLVVGADAEREVMVDHAPVSISGSGYWTSSPLPDGPRRVHVEVRLRRGEEEADPPSRTGREVRCSFSVVTDLERFGRPEWLVPADEAQSASMLRFSATVELDSVPGNPVIQVGSEGPCSIVVNGQEVGRQGSFEPYAKERRPQVMPYDVGAALRPGHNEIALQVADLGSGAAAWVDSLPSDEAGLGLVSDLDWSCTRDGSEVGVRLRRQQWLDPRWACLWPRPHPLPRTSWLDPRPHADAVLDVVPDAGDDNVRREWLRFVGPVGATELRVPTDLPCSAVVGGEELTVADGDVRLSAPLPPATEVYLRFDGTGGHRAGGLLGGPVEVQVTAAAAPLVEWEQLGLRSLGGSVTYRRSLAVAEVLDGQTVVLDLGEVRGSVEVLVNGVHAATLLWSPYRADVTRMIRPGDNQVEVIVRGTLAGYLDDASPTPGVYAGQTRHGLLGPVRLLRFGD